MKLKDARILLISARNFFKFLKQPLKYTEEKEWQIGWHEKIKQSILLDAPACFDRSLAAFWQAWRDDIVHNINSENEKPIVIIAHSYGVALAIDVLNNLNIENKAKIKGAFFVAPALPQDIEIEIKNLNKACFVISSQDDPFMKQETAQDLAQKLGALFLDAGNNQHINSESGHGPWPEGLLVFSEFMTKL